MGLRDNYTPAPSNEMPPVGAQTAVTAAIAGSEPSSNARDLAALRARLARNGGVNPPEAEIPNDALDRTTRETPDGGAEPLPAPAPAEGAGTAIPQEQPVVSLSRGQKAAATRAANKVAAASVAPSKESATESVAPVAPPREGATTSDTVYAYDLSAFSLEQLLREVLKRVQ